MKFRITFLDTLLVTAAVNAKPNLLERLLGRKEQDFMAVAIPHIRGGLCWTLDHTGRPIEDEKLLGAIDAARVKADKAQRDNAQWARRNGLDGRWPYVS